MSNTINTFFRGYVNQRAVLPELDRTKGVPEDPQNNGSRKGSRLDAEPEAMPNNDRPGQEQGGIKQQDRMHLKSDLPT